MRAEWALLLRCAEQAAATAFGGEPATDPGATDLATTTGAVLFGSGSQHHTVHTARDSDLIAALAIQ